MDKRSLDNALATLSNGSARGQINESDAQVLIVFAQEIGKMEWKRCACCYNWVQMETITALLLGKDRLDRVSPFCICERCSPGDGRALPKEKADIVNSRVKIYMEG